jgi:putative DNA primase/helicase
LVRRPRAGVQMSAADAAQALGGRRSGGGYEAPCPVPSHGRGRGDRNHSLSLRDGDKGLLVKCHAGCNSLEVLAELRRQGLLQRGPDARPAPKRDLGEYARTIWHEARPISGTLAEEYLRRHRGIAAALPPSLRFHPRLKHPCGRWWPAMVAGISGNDRKVRSVQVTWIDPDTTNKLGVGDQRRTYGSMGNGAVRLCPAMEQLGIAEGVETALSVTVLFGIACWACLGSARLDGVDVPDRVQLHIFGDRDEPKAVEAAERLGAKLHLPPFNHKDFNDVLIGGVA